MRAAPGAEGGQEEAGGEGPRHPPRLLLLPHPHLLRLPARGAPLTGRASQQPPSSRRSRRASRQGESGPPLPAVPDPDPAPGESPRWPLRPTLQASRGLPAPGREEGWGLSVLWPHSGEASSALARPSPDSGGPLEGRSPFITGGRCWCPGGPSSPPLLYSHLPTFPLVSPVKRTPAFGPLSWRHAFLWAPAAG